MDEFALQEAISSLDSHQFTSCRAVTRHYNVSEATLRRRIDDQLSRG
jgi:DeoR/GlpR family transcriptional regulator of sugar metabolism